MDIRGDPYGLLAAHPVAPLVSLHHLDSVNPIFPGQTQVDSLKKLMQSYHVDSGLTLQQSFCYDRKRKWSVSIAWGYTAQLYPSLVSSRLLTTPLQTFRTWRSRSNGPFVFNTRPFVDDPCERPIVYFLDQVQDVGKGKTLSTYKRVPVAGKCNQLAYKYAMLVDRITVTAMKSSPDQWLKSASYNAGQAKGQAQEKTSQMADKAGDMMQSAKESVQEAGTQMKAKAQDAAEAVKNATGMNK
ncbi:hypothetical protein KSS87_001079 [Heliosperma pusillum]|nr:hypothetical protein KSS87_001079 [Heliosperma pusillum]